MLFPDVPSERQLGDLFAAARERPASTEAIREQEARLRAGQEPQARVLPEDTRVEAGHIVAERPPVFETFEQRQAREQVETAAGERQLGVQRALVDEQVALFPEFLQERVRGGMEQFLQPAFLRGQTGEVLAGAQAFHEDVIVPLAALATVGVAKLPGENPLFPEIQALERRFDENRRRGMALEDAARDAYANTDLPPGVKGLTEIIVDPLNVLPVIGFGGNIVRGSAQLVQRFGRAPAVQMVKRASQEIAEALRARVPISERGFLDIERLGGLPGGEPTAREPFDLVAARNAARAARESGQADLIKQADEAVAQADAAQLAAAAERTPDLPSRRPEPAPKTNEEAAVQHVEAAAPDGADVPPPPEPPGTAVAGVGGGKPPRKPKVAESLKRAIKAQLESEQIPERMLIQHEAAINAAQREARAFVNQGNKQLRDLNLGKRAGPTRAARTEDIARFDELYEALHSPSGVRAGRVRVPTGLDDVFANLREAMDWESAARLDFDPQMALVDDYFYRGWKVPEGVAGSGGRLVSKPGFKKPRMDATYAEMREAGFEPLFWNPYEQWFIARMQGVRYRQQMELVEGLKGIGDEMIRPHAGGPTPKGWRVPEVGPAFEGKPFAFIDKATGDAQQTFSRRWMTTDDLANRLENIYGKKPDLSKIHVGSKDIDISKVVDWLAFVPKRAKLVGSLFQHGDFLQRRAGDSFSNMVNALRNGEPVAAVMALANYPVTVVETVVSMFVPGFRKVILQRLADTTPLFAGRKLSMKMIADQGLSIRDVTIFPSNIDEIAQEAAQAAGIKAGVQKVVRMIGDLERLSRESLFNGLYPAVIISDTMKNIAPMMLRLYPKLSDEQLAALIARAANIRYSVIPASQSTIQNRFLRNFLTRFFFSMGETEGLLRQATNVFKGPQKAFWVENWLGMALYLAAAANTIHFFSTGKPLPADRYSPISTDSFGPLPFGYNRDFMSPDIPFTGRSGAELTLDLVGQMDTVFRVLNPQSFVEAREQVFVRAIQNQVTGTDFFGAPINDVGPWGVVSRTAQLINDLFAPIGVGQAGLQLAREAIPGAETVIPPAEDRLGRTGTLIQATGANVRAETNPMFKNRWAVQMAEREGWRQRDGSPIMGIDDLEPWMRRELERQDVYQNELILRRDTAALRGSARTLQEQISDSAQRSIAIDALAEKYQGFQRADDLDLAAGTLPPERWRNNRRARLIAWNGERTGIFQGVEFQEPDNPAEHYYAEIARVKEANSGLLDSKAWQELDSWIAAQPSRDQEFISRNTGIGDYTQQEQQYYADIGVITGTGYWEVGDNFVDRFALPREAAEVWEQFQRAGDQGQRNLRQQFGDLIRDLVAARTNLRNALIVENPSLETALLRWEFITSPRTQAGQQFLQVAFPRRGTSQPEPRVRRRSLAPDARERRRSLVPAG